MTERESPIAALRKISDRVLRDAETWPDLAAYVDAPNEEYQGFLTLVNQQKIGHHVPRISRPKALPRD